MLGESGDAPPVAEEASRFRGNAPAGGPEQGPGAGRHDGGKFRFSAVPAGWFWHLPCQGFLRGLAHRHPVPWLPLWGSCRRSRRKGDSARAPSAPSGGTSPTGGGIWADLPPWGCGCRTRRLASLHRTIKCSAKSGAATAKTGGSHHRRPTGGVILCAKPMRCSGLQIRKSLRTHPGKPIANRGL